MLSLFLLLIFAAPVPAQQLRYSTAQAHSHNDYHQPVPFETAYGLGYGSIEADIFLVNGELLIAHDTAELKLHRTLEQYYLQPLFRHIAQNNGRAYADSNRHLQLLIDVKTQAAATLSKLVTLLRHYPALTGAASLKWVISGNRPLPDLFGTYPVFIWFDGELKRDYNAAALSRIAMLSDNFANYSRWDASADLLPSDLNILQSAVQKARQVHKPVRFWNAPDNERAWQQFISLHVGFINTDQLQVLDAFLKKSSK